jgi:hypothetical protein
MHGCGTAINSMCSEGSADGCPADASGRSVRGGSTRMLESRSGSTFVKCGGKRMWRCVRNRPRLHKSTVPWVNGDVKRADRRRHSYRAVSRLDSARSTDGGRHILVAIASHSEMEQVTGTGAVIGRGRLCSAAMAASAKPLARAFSAAASSAPVFAASHRRQKG